MSLPFKCHFDIIKLDIKLISKGDVTMSFQEKLNQIITILDINSLTLSQATQLDSSLISRYRNGKRTPHINSVHYRKLIDGIYLVAKQSDKENELRVLCLADAFEYSINNDFLKEWLIPKDSLRIRSRRTESPNTIMKEQFSYRFSNIMDLLEISNIRLAKYLTVDASLISRYRHGLRIPSFQSELSQKICDYFINKATAQQKLKKVQELISYRKGQNFNQWLYDYLYYNKELSEVNSINYFLGSLDSLNLNSNLLPESVPAIDSIFPIESLNYYEGIEGLRSAVKRFLESIRTQASPQELLLYSDQPMDWLSENKEFAKLWSLLMTDLLSKKNRIKIIHHCTRNLNEMIAGITSWLPLYLSGLITPYYCMRNEESHFCHTLFISKQVGAITSSFVKGAESASIYHYITEQALLQKNVYQYEKLLMNSAPLLNIYTQNERSAYLNNLNNLTHMGGDMTFLSLSPSLMTMSSELLFLILERNQVPPDEITEILKYHKNLSSSFHRIIQTNRVIDLSPIQDKEVITSHKVRLVLNGFLVNKPIYYNEQEYTQHMSAIHEYQSTNANYQFYQLPKVPFKNIEIISNLDHFVLISNVDTPSVAFEVKHPQICEAIEEYLHSFKGKM